MDKLKEYLKTNRLKHYEFAEGVLMSRPRFSMIMTGKRNLSPKDIANIVRATGGAISAEDLLPAPCDEIQPFKVVAQ